MVVESFTLNSSKIPQIFPKLIFTHINRQEKHKSWRFHFHYTVYNRIVPIYQFDSTLTKIIHSMSTFYAQGQNHQMNYLVMDIPNAPTYVGY